MILSMKVLPWVIIFDGQIIVGQSKCSVIFHCPIKETQFCVLEVGGRRYDTQIVRSLLYADLSATERAHHDQRRRRTVAATEVLFLL